MPTPEQAQWLEKIGVRLKQAGQSIEQKAEDLVDTVKQKFTHEDASPDDLEKAQEEFERAEKLTKYLAAGSELAKQKQAAEALNKLSETLGTVGGGLKTAVNVRKDVRSLAKIHRALDELDALQAGNDMQSDAAAQAFGELFEGAGEFMEKLPPPFNAYATIVKSCNGQFFGALRRQMDPGPEGSTSESAQFRELEKSGDL